MNKRNNFLFAVFSLLQMLDYITTYIGFGSKYKELRPPREINPLMRSVVEGGQWRKLFLIKTGAIIIEWLVATFVARREKSQKNTTLGFALTNIYMTLVIINNLFFMRRMEKTLNKNGR